jgi:hypothetical protein
MARKKLWFLFLHGKNPTQKAPLSWPNLNLITCKVLIFKYHHIVNQGFGIWIRRHSLVSWRWCTRWSRTSRIQTQEMPVESGMGVERRHCSQHQKSCYKTLGRSLQVAFSMVCNEWLDPLFFLVIKIWAFLGRKGRVLEVVPLFKIIMPFTNILILMREKLSLHSILAYHECFFSWPLELFLHVPNKTFQLELC